MATLTTTVSAQSEVKTASGNGLVSLYRIMMTVIMMPVRFYRARSELALLASMDEHQLRDIGLTRADIANVTALPLDRSPTLVLAAVVDERRSRRPRL